MPIAMVISGDMSIPENREAFLKAVEEMAKLPLERAKEPNLFKLGETYQTIGGDSVTFMEVANEGTHYETMVDQHGHHRYTRRGSLARVTGCSEDYPGNVLLC